QGVVEMDSPRVHQEGTLSLGGNGDYATIPSASDLQNPTEITIEAWIYPRSTLGHGWFISKGDGQTVNSQRTYEMDWVENGGNTGIGVGIEPSFFLGTDTWAVLGAPLPALKWSHVAATFQSSTG